MASITSNPVQYRIKLVMDKLVAVVAILAISPLLIIIGLMIRAESSGPAVFKQKRLGYRGKGFEIYKFRTMAHNAADIRNEDGTTYNAENDPRQTKTGKLLRSTSLDELPQLLNVIRGEMSLVGPRPDLPEFLPEYNAEQIHKLDVLPGITGMAQVNGRNEIPLAKRLAYDVYYVDNFSLKLDIKIILKTVYNVMRGSGVYVRGNQ
jgi:lipopolysaccharide/colanic/teichoic acid biosynthesis glycosyltransferase